MPNAPYGLLVASFCAVTLIACGPPASDAGAPGQQLSPDAVTVSISPDVAEPRAGEAVTFSADVAGTSIADVRWSVAEPGGGDVDAHGRYTAPIGAGTYHVVATSIDNDRAVAVATVTVGAPDPVAPPAEAPSAPPAIPGPDATAPAPALPDPAPTPPPPGTAACRAGATADKLAVIAREGVLFAHASIGSGILAGLARLDTARVLRVDEVRIGATVHPTPGHLASLAYGDLNGYPDQKITAWRRALLEMGLASAATVAQFKSCYTDWNDPWNDTQAYADARFAEYQAAVAALEAAYPGLRVIHWTVPLVGQGYDAFNALREYYSDKIRATYPAADVFDVADAESRDANGANPCLVNGVRCVHPSWTVGSDNAHLNDAGYENAARAWLDVMACPASTSGDAAATAAPP